jgi:hypothetical protein
MDKRQEKTRYFQRVLLSRPYNGLRNDCYWFDLFFPAVISYPQNTDISVLPDEFAGDALPSAGAYFIRFPNPRLCRTCSRQRS